MRKILLKRLLYEVVEDLVFVSAQIQKLDDLLPRQTDALVDELDKNCQRIQAKLFGNPDELKKIFDEGASDEEQVRSYLQTLLPEIKQDVNRLSQAVYRLHHGKMPAEMQLFLNNMNLERLQPGQRQQIVVVPTPTDSVMVSEEDFPLQTSQVVLEQLPMLAVPNVLRWVDVLSAYANRFCQSSQQLQSLMMDLHSPEYDPDIMVPLVKLRLMGPAFYAYHTLQALKTDNLYALVVMEPLLFQGLNRFGLVNKDLVILHQAVEKHRQSYDRHQLYDISERWLRRDEEREKLLQVIEKVIPEWASFNEKSFYRAQLLEDRLMHGMLISAVPMMHNPNQLLDDLHQLENREDKNAIYNLIHQLAETPATPLEIINAAWLHKMDESRKWLQQAFEQPPEQAWLELRNRILDLNVILLKSIETSEVSRMLLYSESAVETAVPSLS